ncbi:uncharacterized protein LOC128992457 [Macrosteles quadrilineatus]|uniref:uncharacterized protein LOC128992457 n=1 Tax=Macrosteles quadrilineatus TaxID=74068 RepID=UPI0023E1D22D|nr:uncharacterized protein LOC128992457 [Macrosteles quadrilineatus]
MYLVGVLVVTLVLAVTAEPPLGTDPGAGQDVHGVGHASEDASKTTTALVPVQNEPPMKMSEFCFFGKFPSATCRFRCHLMRMEAFCEGAAKQVQSGEGKCKCRPETKPTPTETPQEMFEKPETHKEQEEEKKPTATPSFTIHMGTAPQEPEEEQQKHHVVFYIFDVNKIFGPQYNQTKPEKIPSEIPGGWAFQHFLALLIILLLFVLIALELYACYKKSRGKLGDTDSIFKNIPMPNKA